MNKNQLIAEIKKLVRQFEDNTFFFAPNTIITSWYDGEQIPTHILKVFIKKNVLYINAVDEAHTDVNNIEKISEWDIDDIGVIYNKILDWFNETK